MLQPKRLKHRKSQRGRMKGAAQRGNRITKGDYALKAMERCGRTRRGMRDMRRLADDENADQRRGAREELFDAKFRRATRQLKNFRTRPQARRKIARLLTVMRERTAESDTSG